jgi:hypothetical protein
MTETEKQDARLAMCDERDSIPEPPDSLEGRSAFGWVAGGAALGISVILLWWVLRQLR